MGLVVMCSMLSRMYCGPLNTAFFGEADAPLTWNPGAASPSTNTTMESSFLISLSILTVMVGVFSFRMEMPSGSLICFWVMGMV